jgi:signal transduction histidine kinase
MEPSTEGGEQDQVLAASSASLVLKIFFFLALIGLLLLSRENYLLYHGIVEILSVIVSITIFSIGWNSRHFVRDNTLLVLAVAYLPIGALDFFHLLSYKGMGVFPNNSANLPTQLWIATRYLESAGLLWAAALLGDQRNLSQNKLLTGWLFAGTLLFVSITPLNIFPDCYIDGQGLTSFKIASEYINAILLILAALIFWKKRQVLDHKIFIMLVSAVLITIASELSFTLYVDVYGLFNFIGHTLKLISIILIYLALVQGSLNSPYQSLFRKLSLELGQRRASEEKLRAVNQELDTFVYTLSHDLRSPLNAVIGLAEYLRDKDEKQLDSESRELLQKIGKLGTGMSATMEDLLTLAKVGRLEQPKAPIAVAEVVDEVSIALASQLIETGQKIDKEPLPEIYLPESLLRQIFSNLLSNALRYGRSERAINIGGELRNQTVRFYVRDHGLGIPTAERERIFDLFYRVSTNGPTDGTGAGLAIVQKIARLYHGKVWVEETPGGGATFWVEMEQPSET